MTLIAPGLLEGVVASGVADVSLADIFRNEVAILTKHSEFDLTFWYDGSANEHNIEIETRVDGVNWVSEILTWWHGVGDPPDHTSGEIQIRWNITGGTEATWDGGNPGTENVWETVTGGAPVVNFFMRRPANSGAGSTTISAAFEFRWSTEPATILSTFNVDVDCEQA